MKARFNAWVLASVVLTGMAMAGPASAEDDCAKLRDAGERTACEKARDPRLAGGGGLSAAVESGRDANFKIRATTFGARADLMDHQANDVQANVSVGSEAFRAATGLTISAMKRSGTDHGLAFRVGYSDRQSDQSPGFDNQVHVNEGILEAGAGEAFRVRSLGLRGSLTGGLARMNWSHHTVAEGETETIELDTRGANHGAFLRAAIGSDPLGVLHAACYALAGSQAHHQVTITGKGSDPVSVGEDLGRTDATRMCDLGAQTSMFRAGPVRGSLFVNGRVGKRSVGTEFPGSFPKPGASAVRTLNVGVSVSPAF